ncbi:neuronal growth regulator 1 isoform X3 [Narcine bancroftii]|uniref:neuronal growth regulator 1 isoform X3 n=1 Tax=Narcine bancroftii TaxID=1343680 RepID=UPI003831E1CC
MRQGGWGTEAMDSLQDGSPCATGQWLAALLLSLCCLLPSCLPAAAQNVDFPWPSEDNVVVRQGDTAVLRCYLEESASKGAWLNRSSIIFAGNDKWSVDPRVSIISTIKREYSLQIQKVEITDDGPYTCSVQTQYNPKTLQMHLIVQVPPKIFTISASSVVNEFSNVTLLCQASGKPEPTITWKHISPSAKDFISEGEYLEISGITRNQAGFYECIANNDVSTSDMRTVRITVNYKMTSTTRHRKMATIASRDALLLAMRCSKMLVMSSMERLRPALQDSGCYRFVDAFPSQGP